MRDLIARALLWVLQAVLPAHGKRRVGPADLPVPLPVPLPASSTAVSTDAWSRPWRGPSSAQVRAIFHAEETRALTVDQRERWRAAAFAEIGVDYDFPTPNITGAGHSRARAAA